MATKTNAMRILDKNKIEYNVFEYEVIDDLSGISVAKKCNRENDEVFKTLVCVGSDRNYYVFVIPVDKNLNLKECAKSVNVKSIEMIQVKDINKVTGYIRGGCSPIGMKKSYTTTFDRSVLSKDTILVSGGKIGVQIEIKVEDLINIVKARVDSIVL